MGTLSSARTNAIRSASSSGVDVVIKVDGAHNPATMKGRSMGWSAGKQTHGEEIESRTRTALEEIFRGAERVRLRTLRFEEVSQAVLDLTRVHSHRA